MFKRNRALLTAMLIGSALCVHAGSLTLITAPDAGTIIPNFGLLGTPGALISSPASGSGFTVSNAGNQGFMIMEQGVSWSGNFAYGDALLWNQGFGPDTITFASAVQSVGFKLQNDFYGGFTGYLDAYDASNTLLGQVSAIGTSNGNGDNSVLFIGVSSSDANIAKVVVSTGMSDSGNLGANDFALGSGSFTASSVPEPSTFALFSLVLGGAAILRKRINV